MTDVRIAEIFVRNTLLSVFPAEWVGRSGGLFSGEAQELQRKSPGGDPGFPIYEAGGGELPMLTLWLKIVSLVVTVRMKLTIRKGR